MSENITNHNQQQQPYKPQQNPPPKIYEQQYSNPKYYSSHGWKISKEYQNEDQQSNLNYLQKEFLKNEYQRQQDEQDRKKAETLRQKEADLYLQQQQIQQHQLDAQKEKQQLIDKKRAMAEMYKAQIEQIEKDKQLKKQQQIEEDRNRLRMMFDDNRDQIRMRQQREDYRRDMISQQQQTDKRQQEYLKLQDGYKNQPYFEIGREDTQKKQQLEKFQRIQNGNIRNFISYDDEKMKKADAFTQAGRAQQSYGGQARQYTQQANNQDNSKQQEKRDYNEQLKRQMIENELRKKQEKQDRMRGYEFDQLQNPRSTNQQNKAQSYQQNPNSYSTSTKPVSQGQVYDIMGNQKNTYQPGSKAGELSKREDQLKYRQLLDMQTEQNRQQKQREELIAYQPTQQYQPSSQQTKPTSQNDWEYDVMGNKKVIYAGSPKNGLKETKKEDQNKYKEMLDLQREQTRQQKMQEDGKTDLERRYNGKLNVNVINYLNN